MNRFKYDTVIIGSGVSGMSCALYLSRAGLEVAILGDYLMSSLASAGTVENYPGIPPSDGVSILEGMSRAIDGSVSRYTENAQRVIVLEPWLFDVVLAGGGVLRCNNVVVATGSQPLVPEVDGIGSLMGNGVYTCAHCDGGLFKDGRVAVIGSGNHAVGDALYLSNIARTVDIFCRRNRLKAIEKIGDIESRGNIQINYNTQFRQAEMYGNGVRLIDQKGKDHVFDGVFLSTGMKPSTDIVRGIVLLNQYGYIVTSDNESSMHGIFACGDVDASNTFKQAVTAASDGAYTAYSLIRKMQGRDTFSMEQ